MSQLVPYKPPPPPIPKGLLKKNELTMRERLWVWNDVVGIAIGLVILTIGITWLSLPLTMLGVGQFITIAGGTILALSAVVLANRWMNTSTPAISSGERGRYGPEKALNHRARAELCLLDRNRRARPHRNNYQYAQDRYSVWPDFTDLDGDGKQVVLILIKHVRPDPYGLAYLLPRRLRFSQRCWWVTIATIPRRSELEAITKLGVKPKEEDLISTFETMEGMANAMEELPHMKVVDEYVGEEMALNIRRTAPKMSTEAIMRARKVLNSGDK